jgi:hypothetical protein
MADLRLIETGDGGDYVLVNNDIEMISGFQNMPYIGLFGGNLKQSTEGAKNREQIFDFWGNYLFHPTEQKIWFNSKTEQLLNEVALTPAGRIEIEQQVKKDLEFMNEFSTITVEVLLISVDRIQIDIKIQQPNIEESDTFSYIWNSTELELIDVAIGDQTGPGVATDFSLDFDL